MSSKARYIIISILLLLLSIVGSATFIYYWEEIERFGSYGYPFIFILSFLAGSSLPIPAPYIVAVFSMSTVLNPFLVGSAAGIASGIGGTIIFLFGRGGRKFLPWTGLTIPDSTVSRWTSTISRWAQNKGSLIVFIMSVTFNPAFGPMAIAMGAVRFSLLKYFVMCLLGSTIKSLFIAYCGYFGLGALLRWLGVNI
jgi:membrane protein YqaA with SNARE-associated domain